MRLSTVPALVLAGASLLVLGGAIFALILFFPLFLLGLGAVLVGLEDRTVQQHDPSLDGTAWRRGAFEQTRPAPHVPAVGVGDQESVHGREVRRAA